MKRVEQDQQDILSFTADSAGALLAYIDPSLRYVYANKAYQDWFGFPSSKVIGNTVEEVVGPDAFALVKPYALRALKGENVTYENKVYYRHTGGRYIRATYVPDFDENGQVRGFASHAVDITEERRENEAKQFLYEADFALALSRDVEATLKKIAEIAATYMADWVVVSLLDRTGKKRRMALMHKDPSRVEWALEMEKRYPARVDEDSAESVALRTGEPFLMSDVPEELIEKNARDPEHLQLLKEARISSAMIVPIKAGSKVLGTITYISGERNRYDDEALQVAQELSNRASLAIENARLFEEAKESEARYQGLAEDLEHRVQIRTRQLENANKELEAFSYSVSHDLRAPLRTISSFSQLLLMEQLERLDEDGKDNLRRIVEASQRMAKLIDDLLQYARLSRVELIFERLDLAEMAGDIIRDFKTKYPDRLVLIDIAPSLPVLGDRNLLRAALENLLENAWKFTSKKDQPCIKVGSQDQDGETVYFVKDNGAGFDMKYVSKLFRPFERLHGESEFPGTGIGLVNVQRIIARHGGRMWAEAAPGQGATFYFTICAEKTLP